jgi:lipid II:glycine glycyltransferase (peptidoglycan interpeptide bridge formation enzyme)
MHDKIRLSHTVARLADDEWARVLDLFEDASIFQTTAFVTAKFPSQQLEHVVVERDGAVIAAAQVRLLRVPLVGEAVAYVLWGPMYRRYGAPPHLGDLEAVLTVLRQEYVEKRGMALRLQPETETDAPAAALAVFGQQGFAPADEARIRRTILIDIRPDIEELRKGLDGKWRNHLKGAEKNGMEIIEGTEDSYFDAFLHVYREMVARKRLGEAGDIRSFRAMQNLLPDRQKMIVILAMVGGEPCAGAICSAIGARGIYLFGGTADCGTRNKASYRVQWRAISWLKERRCTVYDLHGINPVANPGVYGFKAGLAGRNGREVQWVGGFEAHGSRGTRLLLSRAARANEYYKKLRSIYGRYAGFKG